MAEIWLAVTKGVLDHAKPPREKERQIAYTFATPEIAARLAQVTTKDRVKLRLGGRITLVVADRGAMPDAIEALREEAGYGSEDWDAHYQALHRDHGRTAYVFRCRHCGRLGGYSDSH